MFASLFGSKAEESSKESANKTMFVELATLANAAYIGNLQEVKTLIAGGDADKPDTYKGSTALHWACRGGKLEVAQWLVEEAGADPALRNMDGRGPVYFACDGAHESVVRWLVTNCGVDVNVGDNIDGQTPLHRLCSAGIVRGLATAATLLTFLIKEGRANVRITDSGGNLPETPQENVRPSEWKGKDLGIEKIMDAARAKVPEAPTVFIPDEPEVESPSRPTSSGKDVNPAATQKSLSRPTSANSANSVNTNYAANVKVEPPASEVVPESFVSQHVAKIQSAVESIFGMETQAPPAKDANAASDVVPESFVSQHIAKIQSAGEGIPGLDVAKENPQADEGAKLPRKPSYKVLEQALADPAAQPPRKQSKGDTSISPPRKGSNEGASSGRGASSTRKSSRDNTPTKSGRKSSQENSPIRKGSSEMPSANTVSALKAAFERRKPSAEAPPVGAPPEVEDSKKGFLAKMKFFNKK